MGYQLHVHKTPFDSGGDHNVDFIASMWPISYGSRPQALA